MTSILLVLQTPHLLTSIMVSFTNTTFIDKHMASVTHTTLMDKQMVCFTNTTRTDKQMVSYTNPTLLDKYMGTCGPAYGRTLVDKHVGGNKVLQYHTYGQAYGQFYKYTSTHMDKYMGDFAKHHQPYEPAYGWDTNITLMDKHMVGITSIWW